MATMFFDAWNSTLPTFEAMFGENWIFNGVSYPAMAIDVQTSRTIVMKGGELEETSVTIFVRNEVFTSSGLTEDQTITVRGTDFTVLELHKEGDDCTTMICGPAQIDVWGK